jgi:hypothetical protein
MQAAYHNPEFAEKVGISKKVAGEFGGGDPLNKKLPGKVSKPKKAVAARSPFQRA